MSGRTFSLSTTFYEIFGIEKQKILRSHFSNFASFIATHLFSLKKLCWHFIFLGKMELYLIKGLISYHFSHINFKMRVSTFANEL